jgi:hypothetical protein
MSAWKLVHIEKAPTVALTDWQSFEVPVEGEGWKLHLVGSNMNGRRGLVSTAVLAFDPVSRKFATDDGEIYLLGEGASSPSWPGIQAWDNWKQRHDIRTWREVSVDLGRVLALGDSNPIPGRYVCGNDTTHELLFDDPPRGKEFW